jgi:monomeric isocitrate dehydrogenase
LRYFDSIDIHALTGKGFNKNKQTGKFQKFSIKGTAFAISKNIQKFGIQPTYFYDDAFSEFEESFADEAVQALGIDVLNFFEKVVEENI